MNFFLSSKFGDSSFVEPKLFTDSIKVEVTTLDSFFELHKIKECKLFKLEAEGFEPEIINGSMNALKLCNYIAIDGGRERGVNSFLTFHKLNNILLNNGFEMIDMHGPSYRALYLNNKYKL